MVTKLKNILRCYQSGMGLKEMAVVFHISRNSTRKYVRLFQSSGRSMEELLAMTEEQLRQELGQEKVRHSKPSERETELEALLPEYAKQLTRKGMSKARLYEHYFVGNLSHS